MAISNQEITRGLTTASAIAIIVTNKLVILVAEMTILAMEEVVQEHTIMHRPTMSTVAINGNTTSTSLTLVANGLRKRH